MVGSPITSCQDDTGSCDTINVDVRPPAGAIKPRGAVALLQAQDAQAGTEPLRGVSGVLQHLLDHRLDVGAERPSQRMNRSRLHSAYHRCCGGMWSGSVV